MRASTLALIACLFASSLPAQAALWPSAGLRVERDLHSADVEVRRRAALSLRELPPSSGARLARAALDDADVDVRLSALDACLGLGVAELGERLVPWLTDAERRVRLAAAEALRESPSPRAVPSLGRALSDADPAVRGAAASALGKSGASSSSEAVLALLGHLDDASPEVRREVALALGELGDARAVVPLIGKVQDARGPVREAVAQSLGQLGDVRAASALVLALHDGDDSVRVAALAALGRLGDAGAVTSIVSVLRSASEPVLGAALDALARIRSPAAIKALIDELATERPGDSKLDVVRALSRVGAPAVPALVACLGSESDAERLAGCALALGKTHALSGASAIQDARQRGALRAAPALSALAELGAPASLPTVLEYLSDGDALVRRAARIAAKALLDPRHPDGRAVEPLEQALKRARSDRAEQRELLELLGQTGSPRAARALLPYAAPSDELALRVSALTALGYSGEAGQVPALLVALDDDSGTVRLAAALALGRLPLGARASLLIDRLERGSEADRQLLVLALAGTVAQAQPTDAVLLPRLESELGSARDAERDAWIELLGRAPSSAAVRRSNAVLASSPVIADRSKLAEALAAQATEQAHLASLLSDPSAAVRANAAWSMGEGGGAAQRPLLEKALSDLDGRVAGNALQSLARIARRERTQIAPLACARLIDLRPVQRALALRALRYTGERCDHGQELALLAGDRSELVRVAAAGLIRDVPRTSADALALSRARERDSSGAVAAECEALPQALPTSSEHTQVLVIPAGEEQPRAGEPFALLRADGLVRLGFADRRGMVFEVSAPSGPLSLLDPSVDQL